MVLVAGAGPAVGSLAREPRVGVAVAAGVTLAGGLASLSRKAIQLRLGYHRHFPRLMLFETAVILIWIATSVAFLCAPPLPLVLFVVAGPMWIVVLLAAVSTLSAAERHRLPRVSDVVNGCRSVMKLRDLLKRLDHVWPFGFINARWDDVPKTGKASAFVIWTAGSLLAASAASALILVGAIKESPSVPSHSGSRTALTSPDTASRGASPAPSSAPRQPLTRSYDELCPNRVQPGYPAPPEEAEKLHALWLGGHGIDGSGAVVAGCAEDAQQMAHHREIWWVSGSCGERVLALGLAASGIAPAMMLGQVARVALPFAEQGVLTGASPRTRIGRGDFQVVHTDAGDYVFIRSALTDDSAAGTDSQGACAPLGSGASRYVVVPPGLIGLWVEVATDGWAWPEASGDRIAFRNTSGEQIATATCPTPQSCELTYAGRSEQGQPHGRIDSGSLQALAPAASG
jgi:hypothetical protein